MRKLLAGLVIGLSLVFSGCSPQQIKDSVTVTRPEAKLTTPTEKAFAALNQGYATHASVTKTLLQNFKDGIITKAEKDAYATDTREGLDYLNTADDFFAAGDITSAEGKTKLANVIFARIQRELAMQAAKEKK